MCARGPHGPGMTALGYCQSHYAPGTARVDRLDVYTRAGIPRDQLAGVMAHELTHGWAFIKGMPRGQAPQLTEGGANLVKYYYLQTRNSPAADAQKHHMMLSKDPVYGDGMRRAMGYAKRYRIRGVLKLLAEQQDFPPGY